MGKCRVRGVVRDWIEISTNGSRLLRENVSQLHQLQVSGITLAYHYANT